MRTLALMLFFLAQAGRLEFDVASVKPGDPADPSSSARSSPGRMEFRNATLKTLVRSAYGLNEFELAGGPGWAATAPFNVDAKFPPGSTRQQTSEMMQNLLADRFKLQIRRETRTMKEYALVLAKAGPRLQPSSPEDKNGTSQGPRMIRAKATPVAIFARMLISAVGAPVIDRTGVTGLYNFDLHFAPLEGTPTEADAQLPFIFTAIESQLGLKLETITGPVEVVIIDHAEKPTEN